MHGPVLDWPQNVERIGSSPQKAYSRSPLGEWEMGDIAKIYRGLVWELTTSDASRHTGQVIYTDLCLLEIIDKDFPLLVSIKSLLRSITVAQTSESEGHWGPRPWLSVPIALRAFGAETTKPLTIQGTWGRLPYLRQQGP